MENRLGGGVGGNNGESGRDEGKYIFYDAILKRLLHRVVGFDFRSKNCNAIFRACSLHRGDHPT